MNKSYRYFLVILSVLYSVSGYSQTISPDNVIPYRIGAKWGFSDLEGKILIKPQYESASFFIKDIAIVKAKDLYYLIDPQNKKVTPKGYSDITFNEGCNGVSCYDVTEIVKGRPAYLHLNADGSKSEDGCSCSEQTGMKKNDLVKDTLIGDTIMKYFVNDPWKKVYGQWIFPVEEDDFEFYYTIEKNNKFGVVFNNGGTIRQILETEYDNIEFWYKWGKGERFLVRKNKLSALMSETETLIPFKYTSIKIYNENFFWVVTTDGKAGYINLKGFEYFKD